MTELSISWARARTQTDLTDLTQLPPFSKEVEFEVKVQTKYFNMFTGFTAVFIKKANLSKTKYSPYICIEQEKTPLTACTYAKCIASSSHT